MINIQYKLINENECNVENPAQIVETVFRNRNFDIEEYRKSFTKSHQNYYSPLEFKHINEAMALYIEHLNQKSHIAILVDDDVDGMTSAAMIYQFTRQQEPNCPLSFLLHKKDKHNLKEEFDIPDDVRLLIVPDAGTNNVKECKKYREQGIDILILDHHRIEQLNPYAVVVNNQDGIYPNPHLSGAGVTYKFMQAVDAEMWTDYADDYLDLAALGIVSDNMEVNNIENRIIIDKGLSRIRNKLFQALIKKREDAIKDNCYGIDAQFYIAPLINALIRVGTYEEKELMFRAFIEDYAEFPYKKRGATETIQENIYDRVTRLATNCRSRQNRMRDKYIPIIQENITKNKLDCNEVVFANVSNLFKKHLTGLIAVKLTDYYKKPVVLLHLDEENKTLGGSGRNYANGKVDNLRKELLKTGLFNYVSGHDNAFGVGVDVDKMNEVINTVNKNMKSILEDKCRYVDFIIDEPELTLQFIRTVDNLRDCYGVGFAQPVIAVENIVMQKSQIELMGSNLNNWKYVNDDNIEFIKFGIDFDDEIYKTLMRDDVAEVVIKAVGKVGFNNYKGLMIPQFVIDDYELVEYSLMDK